MKYFIPNPGANPRIEFWLDRPSVWTKKIRYLRITGWCLATTGEPLTELRARLRGKKFSRALRDGATGYRASF